MTDEKLKKVYDEIMYMWKADEVDLNHKYAKLLDGLSFEELEKLQAQKPSDSHYDFEDCKFLVDDVIEDAKGLAQAKENKKR